MLSKPQSQEEEQGSTWRRDQLHLEGADGSQEASKEFGEEEEDLADGGGHRGGQFWKESWVLWS